MPLIRLTVHRLYAIENDRMVATQATARVFVGDECIATEEINGLTESPVFKHIHHSHPAGREIRVEWDTPGFAEMAVSEQASCQCCHPGDLP